MTDLKVGMGLHYWPAMPDGFNHPERVLKHMETAQPHIALVTFVHKDGRVNVARFNHEGMAIPEMGVPVMQDDAVLPTHGGWAVLPDSDWRPAVPEKASDNEGPAIGADGGGDPNMQQPGPNVTT